MQFSNAVENRTTFFCFISPYFLVHTEGSLIIVKGLIVIELRIKYQPHTVESIGVLNRLFPIHS